MKKITLANLHLATAQEVFDQVKNHLVTQNAKSDCIRTDGMKVCVYRTTNGLCCAAGCLIAEEEYKVSMDCNENTTWHGLVLAKIIPTKKHAYLISLLQTVHDQYPASEWPTRLHQVASQENLSY